MRFYIHTLGCKINQYESQALREAWAGLGWHEVRDPGRADVILINTCAVTARAEDESARLVRSLAAKTTAKVVATGCAASLPKRAWDDFRVLTIPQGRKVDLLRGVDGYEDSSDVPKFADTFAPLAVQGSVRARGVVKVQDGCSHRCSYCIIPETRGPSRSRPAYEVIDEVDRLFSRGVPEVILSGINLRQFGMDLHPRIDFWDLVADLGSMLSPKWAGRARIRLGSLEPSELGAKALDTLEGHTLVCPHLHISLQSASPRVLKAMNRGHYTAETVGDFIRNLERFWPSPAIGVDLLVGFPGETEEDFARTREFCLSFPVTYGHVFPFSPRPGTPAATMPGQVGEKMKKERAKILREILAGRKQSFLERISSLPRMCVVPETGRKGVCGRYMTCVLHEGERPMSKGRLVDVRPCGVHNDACLVRCDGEEG